MNEYNEAQRFVSEVTGTKEEERRERDRQACARRLAQIEKKRQKDAQRMLKEGSK